MDDIPRISAIVPTHRRLPTLSRALASIARQQLPPCELIVVNDGPSADRAEIAAMLPDNGAGASRVVQNDRARGPSGARNCGAQLAQGSWLAFLDDDDEWLPAYLEVAALQMATAPLDALCTAFSFEWTQGTGKPGRPAFPSLDTDAFLTRNPGLVGSNLIVRRKLYLEVGGFDESLPFAEDQEFGLRLCLRGGVAYQAIATPLVRLYQHGGERLCSPRSDTVRIGVRRFFELHRDRMTPAQRQEFSKRMQALWGVDEHGRLV